MTTRVILARHGETASSRERRFAGSTDVELTDAGRDQARALATRLGRVRIDALYASPLLRCRQTTQPITELTGREATFDERLRECHFGEWEDLSPGEVLERDRDGFERWFADEAATPHGGESWAQVGERCWAWFEDVAERHEGETVVAVAHGGVILSLTRRVVHAPYRAIVSFEIDPCSLTVVQSLRGFWRIRHLNDTTHIADPLLEGPPPVPMPP